MKRSCRWFLLVAVAAVSLAGCTTFQDPPGAADDSNTRLVEDVSQRLHDDPITSQSTYGVTAEEGVVTIRGAVPSDVVRARVTAIARSTPGVVTVIDRMSRW